jgi:hypothetical protein
MEAVVACLKARRHSLGESQEIIPRPLPLLRPLPSTSTFEVSLLYFEIITVEKNGPEGHIYAGDSKSISISSPAAAASQTANSWKH